jgi:hypothetical protein
MTSNPGDGPSPRRPGPRARVLAAMTALAGVALLVTACGGSSQTLTAAVSANYQKALAYAHCMRSHGVPSFPDPDSQGRFTNLPSGVSDAGTKQASLSAQDACRHLAPSGAGVAGSDQLSPAQQHQLLQYAACMRAHGIPNFPDPTSAGFDFSAAGINPGSPQLQTANHACSSMRGHGR